MNQAQLAQFTTLFSPFWSGPESQDFTEFEFATGIVLSRPPDWLARAVGTFAAGMTQREHELVGMARWAVTFDLPQAGIPGPDYHRRRGFAFKQPFDRLGPIEIALWLAKPSRAAFVMWVHYERAADGTETFESHAFRRTLRTLVSTERGALNDGDFSRARDLWRELETVGQGTSVETAVTALTRAMQEDVHDLRYVLLWIALEALFGPKDPVEATFRLRQSLSLFLGRTRRQALDLWRDAGKAYGLRSKIVHGRTTETARGMEEWMPVVESWVRDALLGVLEGPYLSAFLHPDDRDTFLKDLAFRGKLDQDGNG